MEEQFGLRCRLQDGLQVGLQDGLPNRNRTCDPQLRRLSKQLLFSVAMYSYNLVFPNKTMIYPRRLCLLR